MSVCLCVIPRERLLEGVPAARGGMLPVGTRHGAVSNRGYLDKQRGAVVPYNPTRVGDSWCGPRQKAVKEKVSVQSSVTAALVCWPLLLRALFEGFAINPHYERNLNSCGEEPQAEKYSDGSVCKISFHAVIFCVVLRGRLNPDCVLFGCSSIPCSNRRG